jgi:hypothetical protein
MQLSSVERETIILYNEGSDEAEVWTYRQSLIRKLKEAGLVPVRTDKHGGVGFKVPKRWVKVSPPRKGNPNAKPPRRPASQNAQSTPLDPVISGIEQGSLAG